MSRRFVLGPEQVRALRTRMALLLFAGLVLIGLVLSVVPVQTQGAAAENWVSRIYGHGFKSGDAGPYNSYYEVDLRIPVGTPFTGSITTIGHDLELRSGYEGTGWATSYPTDKANMVNRKSTSTVTGTRSGNTVTIVVGGESFPLTRNGDKLSGSAYFNGGAGSTLKGTWDLILKGGSSGVIQFNGGTTIASGGAIAAGSVGAAWAFRPKLRPRPFPYKPFPYDISMKTSPTITKYAPKAVWKDGIPISMSRNIESWFNVDKRDWVVRYKIEDAPRVRMSALKPTDWISPPQCPCGGGPLHYTASGWICHNRDVPHPGANRFGDIMKTPLGRR